MNGANPNDPSAMRNYEEWFEYDKVGNILKMIHDAQSSVGDWTRHYKYETEPTTDPEDPYYPDDRPKSNRLVGTTLPGDDPEEDEYSAEYTHDTHGNMLTMPHLSDGIEWDFKDQMHHVDKGGGGDVYFVYDASGQRIRKVWEHSGIIEERIYLGGFELYRRHVSGDVVLERETLHIMDDQQRIAMVETKTIDEAAVPFTITPRIRYQLGNHLGSAMLELDDEGLVISYEEYHPYGTSAYRAVDDSIEVSAKRYRYTGKERDEETGLYYHGARYYACWLGRWTSADPAGMVDGPNLFQYVRGRPIGSSDPLGREAFDNTTTSVVDPWEGGKAPEYHASVTGDYNVAIDDVVDPWGSPPRATSSSSTVAPPGIVMVFYMPGLSSTDTLSFRTNAMRLAEETSAQRWKIGTTKKDEIVTETGVTPTPELSRLPRVETEQSIIGPVQKLGELSGQKISEIHLVGHLHVGLRLNAREAKLLKPYVTPDVKIVLHGCLSCALFNPKGQPLNKEGMRAFLTELPGARLYGHTGVVEAGMPYGFDRVKVENGTLTFSSVDRPIGEVVPESYAQRWVQSRSTTDKVSKKGGNVAHGLEYLQKDPDVSDDVKALIKAELQRRTHAK